jgi:hypothetical protein
MYRVRVLSALGSLFLLFYAGSCARMQTSRSDVDLLATGLVGWQQIGGQPGAWCFADGVLWVEGKDGGWLATSRPYGNFGLSLEFRVSPGGDSGVYLRAPLAGDPACAGVEIQIADDYARRSSPREPWQYTGSIYGVQAPSDRVSWEAGRWQEMVIIAEGLRIRVGLNGKKIVDTDLTYYAHLVDTHPGLARRAGYIGLQSDGSRVEFRNLTIRELP